MVNRNTAKSEPRWIQCVPERDTAPVSPGFRKLPETVTKGYNRDYRRSGYQTSTLLLQTQTIRKARQRLTGKNPAPGTNDWK